MNSITELLTGFRCTVLVTAVLLAGCVGSPVKGGSTTFIKPTAGHEDTLLVCDMSGVERVCTRRPREEVEEDLNDLVQTIDEDWDDN